MCIRDRAEENAEDCKNVTIEYYLKAGETYSFIMEYFYYNVRMSVAINFVGDETSTTEKNSEEDVITDVYKRQAYYMAIFITDKS